jgi:hypothetical protein
MTKASASFGRPTVAEIDLGSLSLIIGNFKRIPEGVDFLAGETDAYMGRFRSRKNLS